MYRVFKHLIEKRSTDVHFFLTIQQSLRDLGIYTRQEDKKGTTESSITRFLTPWLAGYKGWVLFSDNDVLALTGLNELFEQAEDRNAVMCVKHDHFPIGDVKLDGQMQTHYPRKNGASVVLWD